MKLKMKHNKKRNTAFLFEVLVNELTKSVVSKNEGKRSRTLGLISKHFAKGTSLYEELQLYKALLETRGLDNIIAEKLIFEVKSRRKYILNTEVFEEQSQLIQDMGKEYTKSVFTNFVPNYKSLATIAQMFGSDVSAKDCVLLETKVIEDLTRPEESKEEKMVPIDSLVYKTFVNKFNDKYGDVLSEEQKGLLSRYISSFSDNDLELKIFLNEEIGRLKDGLNNSIKSEELKSDDDMLENAKKVLSKLEDYAKEDINEDMIRSVLKIQQLVQELRD